MAVSAMLAIGVLPGTKRKSSGEYPRTASNAFAKMGHSATPKGLSSVGAPYSSQSGCPMVAQDVSISVRRARARSDEDQSRALTVVTLRRGVWAGRSDEN